ncbi:MAG: hypothetical protein L0213_07170 [Candidatus Dadabacteria bacterium]|nr:hypothetical protein [Candidatus Dadabacteria bacterium]
MEFTITKEMKLVNVVVLDDDGNHVKNLRISDFKLFENGDEREILSLDEFDNISGEDEETFAQKIEDKGDRFRRNPVCYFIIVGQLNQSTRRKDIEKIFAGFVNGLFPNENISILSLPKKGLIMIQNPTSDREILKSAFGRALGLAYDNNPTEISFFMEANLLNLAVTISQVKAVKNIIMIIDRSACIYEREGGMKQSPFSDALRQVFFEQQISLHVFDVSKYLRINYWGMKYLVDNLGSVLNLLDGRYISQEELQGGRFEEELVRTRHLNLHYYTLGYNSRKNPKGKKFNEIELECSRPEADELIYIKTVNSPGEKIPGKND